MHHRFARRKTSNGASKSPKKREVQKSSRPAKVPKFPIEIPTVEYMDERNDDGDVICNIYCKTQYGGITYEISLPFLYPHIPRPAEDRYSRCKGTRMHNLAH